MPQWPPGNGKRALITGTGRDGSCLAGVGFEDLVRMMVESDMEQVGHTLGARTS